MLNKGVILSERYEIIERIGTGGMADVYRAIDHKLNRYVAIKVLKKEYSDDKQFVAKFRSEARSAAVLNNPNIVSVYDVGNDDNTYYIVLELIEGITLKKYIERKGHLQYKEAVSIAIQIANGMEAAHEHHIVHRDIKPQNIIISKDGKVKVTDFGIARVATSTTTVASNAMGSVHYMSPEQARGGYLDERSDIYSFGITLFEMLTGQVPFDGDTTVAVAVHHIQDELEPPSEFISGIPISVDKIVQKCTNKKQDLRYQSVSDLVSDLKKSLIMPDVDFVQDPSAFAGAVTVNGAENTDGTETKLVDTDKAKEAADKEHDIVDIDDEDSLTERFGRSTERKLLDIAVIRVPRISNFTDFSPFEHYENVSLRYVNQVSDLHRPDMILLPGTKSTIADLRWLRQSGLEAAILKAADAGTLVFGICGGYQMLGRTVSDPEQVEAAGVTEINGLGLLEMDTEFRGEKVQTQTQGVFHGVEGMLSGLNGLAYEGYEIHMGRSQQQMPALTGSRNIYGSHVHGIFDAPGITDTILKALCARKGVSFDALATFDACGYKERQYDLLADVVRGGLDMSFVYRVLRREV